jgi:predicted ester cyclase
MSVEENKKSCYRCFEEIWNKGDLSVIPEIISPDYVGHNVPQEYIGQEGFKSMMQTVLTAFPDVHVSVDDVFGEGDKLAVRITTTGTQTGKYGDAEPTGESMKNITLLINRYVDGKCVESTPYSGQT